MRLCAHCHRREATPGYQKCAPCRANNNRAARAYYAREHERWPEPTRTRTLKLLTTFLLSPRELSCALDISVNHASIVLLRLWQQGICERWPYTDRSYRYRLRATNGR